MITIEKPLSFPNTYPLERIGKREEILFFDIETTGFSGDYSHLYLIGCVFFQNGNWNLIQWFADKRESEKELLQAFFLFLQDFCTLVHFNGDGFDIPYLLKRCRNLGLSYDFSSIKSLDLYKKIKPYRKLLGLKSMKQKAVERFLGVSRTDVYSGGELIQVYQDYLTTHEKALYDLLILHNEDDLKGMPAILPILCYPDFLEGSFRLVRQKRQEKREETGNLRQLLRLICESEYQIPVSFNAHAPYVSLQADKNRMILDIPLYTGILKHFYPNYKDYYYLIYEDTAIHKSIGEYVDRNARTKATAKTCYTKKEGCFLPQFDLAWEPVMKQEYKGKVSYVSLSDLPLEKEEVFQIYISQLLKYLNSHVEKE